MSKVVRVSDSNYRVIVASGGTITLDTTNAGAPIIIEPEEIQAGETYVIEYTGNGAGETPTDFTLIGAENNNIGTVFAATGPSTGDGYVTERYPATNGSVVVKGNLEVKGRTLTIESTQTSITDNIIILSDGNESIGLPASLDRPYSSGIQIDRGTLSPTRWVYDDSVSWAMGADTGTGMWLSETGPIGNSTFIPLYVPGIVSPIGDLYLNTGSGVVTVEEANNYELNIWRYENGALSPDPITGSLTIDDDHIPNTKAVRDYVDYSINFVEIDKLQEDNSSIEVIDKNNVITAITEVGIRTTIATTNSHGYTAGDSITIQGVTTSPTDAIIEGINGTFTVIDVPSSTTIEINADTSLGDKDLYVANSGSAVSLESKIVVTVSGSETATFYSNRTELSDLQILGSEISTYNSNDTLTLSAPGSGSVRIKDTLELTKTPGDDDGLVVNPNAPIEGVKIYSKTPDTGQTGIFYINEQEQTDELISKNRALLYGMIF